MLNIWKHWKREVKYLAPIPHSNWWINKYITGNKSKYISGSFTDGKILW